MTDCPQCGRPVDGMWCAFCTGGRRKRTAPPMGFEALKAKCEPTKRKHDPEADAERAAIQGEASSTWNA